MGERMRNTPTPEQSRPHSRSTTQARLPITALVRRRAWPRLMLASVPVLALATVVVVNVFSGSIPSALPASSALPGVVLSMISNIKRYELPVASTLT